MNRSYMGRVMWVDLTHRRITIESIPDDLYRRFLSGTGLAAWLLYDRIPAGADALGPDNVLGFVSGLLTASGSLFTGRWMAVGKSPLTGTWGDSNCGGNLAPAIKGCGLDAIFFTGQSDRPVYLHADTKGASLHDAGHLWGRDAIETERQLVSEYGVKQRARVACIGTAGERRSLIAGIVNHGGRLAARGGLG
ncbi:MAG: aldehyde ferredoxin oxidoreductase N-terminal domain-containing protein, partial [Desulfosarcina sp.]